MREIGAFEAKNKFGQLLDWVEAGEEIVITRRGKVVARMVAPDSNQAHKTAGLNPEAAKVLLEKIRMLRESARLDGLSVRQMINEGRTPLQYAINWSERTIFDNKFQNGSTF